MSLDRAARSRLIRKAVQARPTVRRWRTVVIAASAAAVLVGPFAGAQTAGSVDPAAPPPVRDTTAARLTGALRSGDLLKVRVYRDSELSGQYLIDAQGNVQIPGLGVIRAAGLEPAQVQDRLVDALRSRGFRAPEISVQPLIRLSVLGQIRVPGLYPVDPGVSLIQLITLAGGPTERANLKRAQVVRDDRAFTIDLQSALGGSAAGRVTLYSNDVVYIPERHTLFSRDNISFIATLAGLALSVVTLAQVSHH